MRLALISTFATVLLMAGCANPAGVAAPVSPATSDSTVAPSPSASVDPSAPEASTLVVHAERIEILSADGAVMEAADLVTETEEVLGVLEEAFGAEPTPTTYGIQGLEGPPGTKYDWGGLVVYVTDEEYGPAFDRIALEISAPAIGDVSVRTAAGLSVGSPVTDLDRGDLIWDEDGLLIFDVEPVVIGTAADFGYEGEPDAEFIWSVMAHSDGSTVTKLFSPRKNYGV